MQNGIAGNKSTAALELIRRDVLRGDWRPGQRLQPSQLAKRYSSSTTVVREGLTRLAGEGFIVLEPNRGFFVPELTPQTLTDLTEVRCTLEELAISLAVERGGLEWESELIGAHHRLARTPRRTPEDPTHVDETWSRAHREFHEALLAGCGVPHLSTFSRQLANSTEIYRRWAAPSETATTRAVEVEHAGILQAVLDRDSELAGRLLREHYELSTRIILERGLDTTTQ